MKVAIIGASGLTGEMLLRLLSQHPYAEIGAISSRRHAGQRLWSVFPHLQRLVPDIRFSDSNVHALAGRDDLELFFLALPHGTAMQFAPALVAAGKRVIDLSADFRISNPATYEHYYGTHQAPELIRDARYVLADIPQGNWMARAKIAAVPGCYATSILVPLLPLISAGIISHKNIVINSCSGVSGTGRKMDKNYLFLERDESVQAYGLVKHRHLAEIEEQLSGSVKQGVIIQFNPHLVPMRRGILSTITVPSAKTASLGDLLSTWKSVYQDSPFVRIMKEERGVDTANVQDTNFIDLGAAYDPRTKNFVMTCALDNLMKGASGQAVQIMNLWQGLPITAGLMGRYGVPCASID